MTTTLDAIKARLDQAIRDSEPTEFIDGLSVALDIAADTPELPDTKEATG